MTRRILLCVLCFCALSLTNMAQDDAWDDGEQAADQGDWFEADAPEDDPKYEVKPTADPQNPAKVYVPKNLEDAMGEMNKMLKPEFIAEIKGLTEDAASVNYQWGLGLWMQTNWQLNEGGRLRDFFTALGVTQGDDMVGIIMRSYWRQLHKKPLDLEGQVKQAKAQFEAPVEDDWQGDDWEGAEPEE